MRKIYMTISTFLLCAGMVMAQAPANRTSKTIAADVLAQMPANEQKSYNDLIGQLSQAGDQAVQTLIGMMNAPGKGSNAKVDYALSGLSHYVMAKGEESAARWFRRPIAKRWSRLPNGKRKPLLFVNYRL